MSTTIETGRFVWYELVTTDVKRSIDFYTHVTGWESAVWQTPGGDIHMFKSGQGPVANLRESTGEKGPHGDTWWSASVMGFFITALGWVMACWRMVTAMWAKSSLRVP